jgi:hypothetical protein
LVVGVGLIERMTLAAVLDRIRALANLGALNATPVLFWRDVF